MLNTKGRVENSVKNSTVGIIAQVINVLLGLIVRTVFIHCLSEEYLGVNGLFSNILTILSLAELGVGNAIIYNLYKPVANKDEVQIAKLMNLYRTAYNIIGICVAVFGSCVVPFLNVIIKDSPDIEWLSVIYLLFLGNTVISYFFAYKRSLFSADQRERTLTVVDLVFQIIRYGLQTAVLLIFRNFIAYLVIQIICTALSNIFISLYADRQYVFLKKYRRVKLTKEERKPVFSDIKALFIYKLGSTALDGTDNIIISAFDGIISVGLLSNYSLLTGSVQTFLNRILRALTGSIGNFIAKEDEEKYEGMLKNVTFLHFLLYGLVFVGGVSVLTPFVTVWAGAKYVVSQTVVFVHCLNIFIFGMMDAVWTFRSTMGLFKYGKWRPLVSAVVNVIVSVWWAKEIGLLGVLLGTTFTRFVTNVWYDPLVIYKHGLKKNPLGYYLRWLCYLAVCFADIGIVMLLQRAAGLNGIISFIVNGLFSVIIFSVSVFVFFGRTNEYRYFKKLTKELLLRLKVKAHKTKDGKEQKTDGI